MVGFLTMTTRGTLPASESCMPELIEDTDRFDRPEEAFPPEAAVSPPKSRALFSRSLVSRRKSVRWRRAEFRWRSAVSSGRANSGFAEMLSASSLLKSRFRKAVGRAREEVGARMSEERMTAEKRTSWHVKYCFSGWDIFGGSKRWLSLCGAKSVYGFVCEVVSVDFCAGCATGGFSHSSWLAVFVVALVSEECPPVTLIYSRR